MLVTETPTRLPVTIRSRCQRLRFVRSEEDVVAAQLTQEHGLRAERRPAVRDAREGSLGRALALEGETLAERRTAAERLHGDEQGGAAESFALSSDLGREKDALAEFFVLLRMLYRDALLVNEGLDERTARQRGPARDGRARRPSS